MYRRGIRILFLVLLYGDWSSSTEDNTIGGRGDRTFTSFLRYPKRTTNMRTQPRMKSSVPFPCSEKVMRPSPSVPTSVHTLRPSDIKVVGAMGDSLVAGNGAMGESVFYTIFENRGVSWCIGGDGNWREYLTLPNILKNFNPKLRGFSTGTGEYFFRESHMNVAFPVASTLDAAMQARVLVKRLRNDATIDFQKDWKLITIFFGANDICTLECFNKTAGSAIGHVTALMKALDYLQEHLPRTFVNLIPVLDVTVSVRVKRSLECKMIHRLFCMCYHMHNDPVTYMAAVARNYQKVLDDLVNSGRYDRRDDFTAVVQPFNKGFNLPSDPRRRSDYVIDASYITYDCFHYSQKGHALAANMLWNNMLEPVGNKSVKLLDHVLQRFACPDETKPYLFTAKNSRKYYMTGHQ